MHSTMTIHMFGTMGFLSLASVVGTVVYAYYEDKGCDPLAAGKIENPNQVEK